MGCSVTRALGAARTPPLVLGDAPTKRLVMAYADPPYPGQALKHYGRDAKEVNHRILINHLSEQFPDGWALSTSATALRDVLNLCPTEARIGVWCKSFASFKPGVNPGYCWEPVIFWRGRTKRARSEPTVQDFIVCPITLKRGVAGAKPDPVCFWIFQMLGLRPGDEFHDIFPGSKAVSRAWGKYVNQLVMAA